MRSTEQKEWRRCSHPGSSPARLAAGSSPIRISDRQQFTSSLRLSREFLGFRRAAVVWTHGSANFEIEDFQSWALEVSRNLNLRCLLISLDPPATMSDTALHVGHARFEDLFPRCKAVVHHGGIGTTAKCIAAGVPQLIIPRSHDQPDTRRASSN